MKLIQQIKSIFNGWLMRYRIAKAQREASKRIASVKEQYPDCESAMATWPRTGNGTAAAGYLASGTASTIRWGTVGLLPSMNSVTTSASTYVITRFNQKTLVENIKLPNGDGLTSGRILLIDGAQWEVTIRDDTGLVPAINKLQVGMSATIVDAAGMIDGSAGTVGKVYTVTIVDQGYEAAPKTPGERTLTVENLVLIESQSSGSQS